MSTGGVTEYDSAAFARKNPGPTYKDHQTLNTKMTAAFDAYLTQKHQFHGIVQCGQHNTLAEAKQWLQWRESHVRGLGRADAKYVATDWTYEASPVEVAAAATTTAQDATAHPNPTPASAAAEATSFFVCVASWQGVAYESAVFEARNDAGTARGMMFKFAAYLGEKYKVSGMPICRSKTTREAAQAYLQEFAAGASGGVSQHVSTGWVYDVKPAQTAQPAVTPTPVVSAAPTPKPVTPAPASPKPVTPLPATAAATTQTAASAPAAKKTMYVVCKADNDPHTRYYNPPVDGGDGSYATWQPSFQTFMKEKYHYERGVACNKQPTLAEAQAYYDVMLEQARLYTSINGVPSPIVITSWQYK